MSEPAAGAAGEAALLARINAVLGRIDSKAVELQSAINDNLHWLPCGLQDNVVAGWNSFCDFLRRVCDNLNEVLANMGSPSALWATADAWSDRVGAPVSAQVQSADAGLLGVDDHWDGDAADAYRQRLPLQKAALDKVKSTLTDGVAAALNDVAKGIIAFWGALVTALLALVGGMVAALASSASIVGLPAAPFIAAAAALTASGTMIVGAEYLKSTCAAANTTLRQKIADNAGFHQGHWPPAATA